MFELKRIIDNLDLVQLSKEMYQLMTELYPICRSITGDGVRKSLRIMGKIIPMDVQEVLSGTEVFDWTIPKEWNISDAYFKDSEGKKIVDFNESNLHVLNYSVPVKRSLPLAELKPHLFSIPEHPEWIPYRTSYYKENWGFCISHNQLNQLKDEVYEVCIDSSLKDGHLTYGEFVIKGQTEDEILISTHVCHPSLCNDNLSGNVISAILARLLEPLSLRYTYRFLFIPGTIGSITWLCLNESKVSNIKHGLVAVCLGDSGSFTYKRTRRGDAEIDHAVTHVLKDAGQKFDVIDFFPFGYDERQYCSPGFDLPVGCLMRTPHGQFPEYHTSADNLDFVKPENLGVSLSLYLNVLDMLENNIKFLNTHPKCEPQLGKRGLYGKIGGNYDSHTFQLAMLWVLNQSDGLNSLLDICKKSNMSFDLIRNAAHALANKNLLREAD